MKLLTSSWTSVALGSILYWAVTGYLLRPENLIRHGLRTRAVASETSPGPSWEFHNLELDRLVAELAKEKQTLQQRAQELDELALRLEAERAEINTVTQTVLRMQQEFDRTILRIEEQETTNLRKLAKVYTAMTPENAIAILKHLEDDQIAKILTFMKEDKSALILEQFALLGETEGKRMADILLRLEHALPPENPSSF